MRILTLVFVGFFSFFVMGFWWLLGKSPIDAAVDKTVVTTGEIFTYTITVDGSFTMPELVLPEFKKVRIASQSQSRSYSIVNSKKQLKTTIRFSLFAPKPGVIKLGPAYLKTGKYRYKSRVLAIKVTGTPLQEEQKISPYIKGGTQL